MAEMILPGTYIEVRAEGLITPGPITVGNLGVVGTANKGPVGEAIILGGLDDARNFFGNYDIWIDGASNELTLVRALEQAYRQGATTVYAVRVASGSAASSSLTLQTGGGADSVALNANSEGRWGDRLSAGVAAATQNAFVEREEPIGPTFTLNHTAVVVSARNRILQFINATGETLSLQIVYAPAAPAAGQVAIDAASGVLTFFAAPAPADRITAYYAVASASAVEVTISLEAESEVYTVASARDLAADLARQSQWVVAGTPTDPDALPDVAASADFTGGNNGEGAAASHYDAGLARLSNEPAHIIVAAGQDENYADELAAHCQNASSDAFQRERIAVLGGGVSNPGQTLTDLLAHQVNSDRVIFVGPGITATDAAALPPQEVTLPGSYAAAAVAGLISALPAHRSPTNKVLNVGGLEEVFNKSQLEQLVLSRVLALEQRQGIKIVQGLTSSTDTAWRQITTRRIVDFAKFGTRSAADPFIGKLNNERVRGSLKGSISSLLADMVDREMLTFYELDVSATRAQEIRGIVMVTMVLQPTFSIDYIRVVMYLQ